MSKRLHYKKIGEHKTACGRNASNLSWTNIPDGFVTCASCWRSICKNDRKLYSYVVATSRAKARYAFYKAADEAGLSAMRGISHHTYHEKWDKYYLYDMMLGKVMSPDQLIRHK